MSTRAERDISQERDEWKQRCEQAEAKVTTLQERTQRHERAKNLGQAVEADIVTMNALRERAEQAEARVVALEAELSAMRNPPVGAVAALSEALKTIKEERDLWKTEHDILADRIRGKVHPLDNGIPVEGAEQPAPRGEAETAPSGIMDIARHLCVYAWDIDGLDSMAPQERQQIISVAEWVHRHYAKPEYTGEKRDGRRGGGA